MREKTIMSVPRNDNQDTGHQLDARRLPCFSSGVAYHAHQCRSMRNGDGLVCAASQPTALPALKKGPMGDSGHDPRPAAQRIKSTGTLQRASTPIATDPRITLPSAMCAHHDQVGFLRLGKRGDGLGRMA